MYIKEENYLPSDVESNQRKLAKLFQTWDNVVCYEQMLFTSTFASPFNSAFFDLLIQIISLLWMVMFSNLQLILLKLGNSSNSSNSFNFHCKRCHYNLILTLVQNRVRLVTF